MHVPAVPKQVIAGDQREQDGPRAYSCTEPGQYISPWRAGPGPVVNQTETCMCQRSQNRSSPEISGNRMDPGHTRARSRVSTSHHGVRDPGPLNPSGKTVSCTVYSPFFDSNPGDESDLLHEEASGAGTLPGAPAKFPLVLLSRDFLPGVLHREGMTLCSGKAGIA